MGASDNDKLVNGVRGSEVNAGIPRCVRFDEKNIKILIGMLFAFLVLISGLACISYGQMMIAQLRGILRQKGYATEGEVTKCSAGLDGIFVIYKFSVDGISYSGHARMKMRLYKVSRPGDQISIRYLPKDPRENLPMNVEVLSDRDISLNLLILSLMGLCALMIYTLCRERRLVRIGVVVEARVTGCAPYHDKFDVYYEFTAENNVSMEGSVIIEDEYEVGNTIPIIYLRSNPKRNERYPVAGFLIEGGWL